MPNATIECVGRKIDLHHDIRRVLARNINLWHEFVRICAESQKNLDRVHTSISDYWEIHSETASFFEVSSAPCKKKIEDEKLKLEELLKDLFYNHMWGTEKFQPERCVVIK